MNVGSVDKRLRTIAAIGKALRWSAGVPHAGRTPGTNRTKRKTLHSSEGPELRVLQTGCLTLTKQRRDAAALHQARRVFRNEAFSTGRIRVRSAGESCALLAAGAGGSKGHHAGARCWQPLWPVPLATADTARGMTGYDVAKGF